jgi:hypothetical protein
MGLILKKNLETSQKLIANLAGLDYLWHGVRVCLGSEEPASICELTVVFGSGKTQTDWELAVRSRAA